MHGMDAFHSPTCPKTSRRDVPSRPKTVITQRHGVNHNHEPSRGMTRHDVLCRGIDARAPTPSLDDRTERGTSHKPGAADCADTVRSASSLTPRAACKCEIAHARRRIRTATRRRGRPLFTRGGSNHSSLSTAACSAILRHSLPQEMPCPVTTLQTCDQAPSPCPCIRFTRETTGPDAYPDWFFFPTAVGVR